MTLIQLWKELALMGISLEAMDGKLKIDAPKGALTSSLRKAIIKHKSSLIALISEPDPDSPTPSGWPKTILWLTGSYPATIGGQWERLGDGTIRATYNTPNELWYCLQFMLWDKEKDSKS